MQSFSVELFIMAFFDNRCKKEKDENLITIIKEKKEILTRYIT